MLGSFLVVQTAKLDEGFAEDLKKAFSRCVSCTWYMLGYAEVVDVL